MGNPKTLWVKRADGSTGAIRIDALGRWRLSGATGNPSTDVSALGEPIELFGQSDVDGSIVPIEADDQGSTKVTRGAALDAALRTVEFFTGNEWTAPADILTANPAGIVVRGRPGSGGGSGGQGGRGGGRTHAGHGGEGGVAGASARSYETRAFPQPAGVYTAIVGAGGTGSAGTPGGAGSTDPDGDFAAPSTAANPGSLTSLVGPNVTLHFAYSIGVDRDMTIAQWPYVGCPGGQSSGSVDQVGYNGSPSMPGYNCPSIAFASGTFASYADWAFQGNGGGGFRDANGRSGVPWIQNLTSVPSWFGALATNGQALEQPAGGICPAVGGDGGGGGGGGMNAEPGDTTGATVTGGLGGVGGNGGVPNPGGLGGTGFAGAAGTDGLDGWGGAGGAGGGGGGLGDNVLGGGPGGRAADGTDGSDGRLIIFYYSAFEPNVV